LLRRWKQVPEYGPVVLLYSEGLASEVDTRSSGDLLMRCEPHPDNESALSRLVQLAETLDLFMQLIVDDHGTAIWTGPELLRECDVRKKRDRQGHLIDA
jgi:hypothetical protein